jgi:Domain of unknown function (DUF4157)
MFQRVSRPALGVRPPTRSASRGLSALNAIPAVPSSAPRASFSFANIPIHSKAPAAQPTSAADLPSRLKSGVESLSGVSMRGVKVHRNSAEPARWQAEAFARGTDIHLAPGQEQQLPHEAWHVAQQRQGRTRLARDRSSGVTLVDDPALESEADRMGPKAARAEASESRPLPRGLAADGDPSPALQRKKVPNPKFGDFETTKFVAVPGQGVEIILKFTPNTAKVDASKIALSQSISTTAKSADAYAWGGPNAATKMVPKGQKGAGFGIDTAQVAGNNNPLYGQDHALGPTQDLKDTPESANKTANPTVVGTNTNYETGFCFKEKQTDPDKKWRAASLWDKPTSSGSKGESTNIETTALAIDGTDKGKYYGSVKWGFKFEGTAAAPTLTPMDIQQASDGSPTENFVEAAKLWNAGKTMGTVEVAADPEATVLKADASHTEKLAKGTKLKQLGTVMWSGAPAIKAEVLRADGSGTGKIIFIKDSDARDSGDGSATKRLPIP